MIKDDDIVDQAETPADVDDPSLIVADDFDNGPATAGDDVAGILPSLCTGVCMDGHLDTSQITSSQPLMLLLAVVVCVLQT